ncbi:hypothetical protein FN846DRAFT_999025 [Sphaerosporella brunnea]|uniref:Uncharacterized protein n=1 Tax=Sphaerosporella brunnea TaxID=1250544 RepID=A0A5J5EIM0_9PEZI|nr:hypothetical protein FN846DRAFT_999025 [Sphaerosporella brunnea]
MATLCGVAAELHIEILSNLPDLRSLAAAIFTSRAIYKSFTIARHDVMEHVLDREIPLASIIGEIECLLPQDCVAALHDRSSSRVRGKALDMLCVCQGLVSAWCRRFCEDTLQELSSEDHSPPSPSERLRIQRVFYRFWALSCAIEASGIELPTSGDDLGFSKTYMLRYSLWEIAELTLVYRYIHWKLIVLCCSGGTEATQLSRHRSWVDLFTADRTNRAHDSAFPPRCICTRRDMPADEYDECLRGTAEDLSTILAVKDLDEEEVRYDLALWDDSRLERLGFFLPAA